MTSSGTGPSAWDHRSDEELLPFVGAHPDALDAFHRLPDERIHVRIDNDFDRADRLREELRDAGVGVKLVGVTSSPRVAGRIELLAPHGASRAEGIEAGEGEFWVDPAKFRGTVEVLAYVDPEPGQDWQQAPSVFHPDEPLGGLPCALDGPLDPAVLERHARRVGIADFDWSVEGDDPRDGSFGIEPSPERPLGEVRSAVLGSPTELDVLVRPADFVERYGPVGRLSMNLNTHTSVEPACTPELAARWR